MLTNISQFVAAGTVPQSSKRSDLAFPSNGKHFSSWFPSFKLFPPKTMATVLPSLINLQYKEAKSHWRPLALNEVTIYNALIQRYNQVDQADFKAHYNNMPKIPHAYLMNKAATKYNRRISEQLWYLLPSQKQQIMSLQLLSRATRGR